MVETLKRGAQPGPGHNSLVKGQVTHETILFYAGVIGRAEDELKVKQKEVARIKKRAKADGINMEIFKSVLRARDEAGAEAVLERFTIFKHYAGAFDLPISNQLNFLDVLEGKAKSEEAHMKHAFDQGRARGIAGEDPDYQAFHEGTPLGMRHQEGWQDGQKELYARLIELNKEAEKPAKANGAAKPVAEAKADGEPAPKKAPAKKAAAKKATPPKAPSKKATAAKVMHS